MTKFLLVVLTTALLAGASRADDAPAQAPPEKSGTVMVAVTREAVEVAARARGRMIGSRIRYGMPYEEFREMIYFEDIRFARLGVSVTLTRCTNAAGNDVAFVDGVFFAPIFPTPRRPVVVVPPVSPVLAPGFTPVAGR